MLMNFNAPHYYNFLLRTLRHPVFKSEDFNNLGIMEILNLCFVNQFPSLPSFRHCTVLYLTICSCERESDYHIWST